jgi:transposase-like protein
MGRRGYPAEFRRRVGDLVEAGRKVTDVARDLGVSNQTIYTWRRRRLTEGSSPDGRPFSVTSWPPPSGGSATSKPSF